MNSEGVAMNADQGMLFSAVCTLHAVEDTTLPATHGHLGYAAFLALIDSVQPALAQALHDTPGRKPFTVSPLWGLPRPRDGYCRLRAGASCWLRLTLLGQELFAVFMERLLTSPNATIRLGRARFQLSQVLTTPGSHPWAGYTSWAQLVAEACPKREIELKFTSPTAFGFGQQEWGKKIVVLPEPVLVFGNLAKSWNDLAPPPWQMDRNALRAYVEQHVVVKRMENVSTQMLRFSRSPQVGFVGRIAYGLMGDSDPARCQLNALADYAFYAGVGIKTTMGMGQVHRAGGTP